MSDLGTIGQSAWTSTKKIDNDGLTLEILMAEEMLLFSLSHQAGTYHFSNTSCTASPSVFV